MGTVSYTHLDVYKRQEPKKAGSHDISRQRLEELQQQDNIRQLLFIVEQYLGRTLGSTHINTILYLYDELHFSEELIEYLVEYCVSRGNRSIRYIETVALAWHAEHITTVEQAQEVTSQYNKYVFTVLKSFGIKGRNPVASEPVSYTHLDVYKRQELYWVSTATF